MPQTRSLPHCPPTALDALRPDILRALTESGRLVLSAPPGTGKSSRLPLWLLQAPWLDGRKIYLLEPRRVATRALGRYMARLLGEAPGRTVGWRMRDENVCGPATRIEVLTEGVLTRLLQADPELSQAACVIFDEFHERSLQTDLALALCLESRAALRPDLRLAVMSATLDDMAVTALMDDCPFLQCQGRTFPIDIRWQPPREAYRQPGPELWRHTAAVIRELLQQEEGSLLAFLPGVGEIRQVAGYLEGHLPPDVTLHPLYGNLSAKEQDAAITPAPSGRRKAVLATSIAETSLTIEGVRLVVDAGLSRRVAFDASCGMSRLVTERVSLAGATQRAGRAGRLEAGICCRLWPREEERAMRAHFRPEILEADLSPLLLQLALWGVTTTKSIRALAWLDTPPEAALEAARELLQAMGALDKQGGITTLGKRMAALPTAPRMARLALCGQERGSIALACCLASLLEERDPLWKSGQATDSHMAHRLDWLCRSQAPETARLRRQAERLAGLLGQTEGIFSKALQEQDDMGALIALAWPEWLGQRQYERNGQAVYLLRQGKTASIPLTDSLAQHEFLAVAALTGATPDQSNPHARIRLAAPLARTTLEKLFATSVTSEDILEVSDEGLVTARRQSRLGGLVLQETPLPRPAPEACAHALCQHIRKNGPAGLARLPWNVKARQLQARMLFLRTLDGDAWPDSSDTGLLENLEDWLAPALRGLPALRALTADQLYAALRDLLPYQGHRQLEKLAPDRWQTPSGAWHDI
ncbi:MAG: ATP-dependent helicase HrpB, partial [Desulfovibrionaceae bacterium]|nr:ATP-dependent helicase HrpB [Desulfovibrionaceae bacterium]